MLAITSGYQKVTQHTPESITRLVEDIQSENIASQIPGTPKDAAVTHVSFGEFANVIWTLD